MVCCSVGHSWPFYVYRHNWHVYNTNLSFTSICLKIFHLLTIIFKIHPHSLVRIKWLFAFSLLPQLLLLLLPIYHPHPHTFNSVWYRGDIGQKFTHYHENEEFKTYRILLRDLGIFQVRKIELFSNSGSLFHVKHLFPF